MFRCFQNAKGAILLASVTVGALYLIVWHGAHLAGLAPVLLLLACPLMHGIGHRGHGHHGHRSSGQDHTSHGNKDEKDNDKA